MENLDLASDGGVEEKKEDDEIIIAPKAMSSQLLAQSPEKRESAPPEKPRTLMQHVEHTFQTMLGSCGQAIEAASLFVQGKDCHCPGGHNSPDKQSRQPLSIQEELRKLAVQEGYWDQGLERERKSGIPAFLGEDAVNSIDDDNISAISQHTLEDMARRGVLKIRKKGTPPSPTRTTSNSSSSDIKK